jgi:hypothetical protein
MDGRMFHFKRRTLWIIIYVTIPLIFVLNSLGPSPDVKHDLEKAPEFVLWSLDEVSTQCSQNKCLLPLEGAEKIVVSAILANAPVKSIEIPAEFEFTTYWLGGKVIGQVKTLNQVSAFKDIQTFYRQWVPREASVQWVISGDLDESDLVALLPLNIVYGNTGVPYEVKEPIALTRLVSPKIGSDDQVAFLMWVEILKRRLAGYDVQVRWDHRAPTSWVVFNTTITTDSKNAVTQSEFQDVMDVYLAAANQRQRELDQLHRYAVNALIYELPFQFFVQQPERLKAVTLNDVNRIREQTLEQISKN